MTGPAARTNRVAFKVGETDAGRRLDQVLAACVPGLSRRQARVLLDIGGVFVDDRRIKMAGRPITASSATVEAPARQITRWAPAIRSPISLKKGEMSASIPSSLYAVCVASMSSARAC